jgi:hypothetical protein
MGLHKRGPKVIHHTSRLYLVLYKMHFRSSLGAGLLLVGKALEILLGWI